MVWSMVNSPQGSGVILGCFLFSLLFAVMNFSLVPGVLVEWDLVYIGSNTMTVSFLFDKMSVIFSLIVVLISLSIMLFSSSYMSKDPALEYFIFMVILFVLSMNILVFMPNLLVLLLGWDGLGLTSYLLVIYYQNSKSLGAGMITALTNRIGDALLILAGAWAFTSGNWVLGVNSMKVSALIVLLVTVGAMTKSAQMPFSAWLPAAMAAPTPVSSLVHSSTLVTAGVYLLIRFFPSLVMVELFSSLVFYSGVVTCAMASLAATVEMDMKKVVALSTLSQLGVMMMALGLSQPLMCFFHLVTHALFKALLFVCVGTVIHHQLDNQDLRLMGNLWGFLPSTCVALNVANLALCGFPFLAGFYSKDSILESFFLLNMPLSTVVLMLCTICITSAYSLRLSYYTLWSPFKGTKSSCQYDNSLFTGAAQSILLSGAVVGGATLSWLLPLHNLMVLPFLLKLAALVLIGSFALLSWSLKSADLSNHFFSSMWFLSSVSSSPLVKMSLGKSESLWSAEMSWMEYGGGFGSASSVKLMSMVWLILQNVRLYQSLSVFVWLGLFIVCVY